MLADIYSVLCTRYRGDKPIFLKVFPLGYLMTEKSPLEDIKQCFADVMSETISIILVQT